MDKRPYLQSENIWSCAIRKCLYLQNVRPLMLIVVKQSIRYDSVGSKWHAFDLMKTKLKIQNKFPKESTNKHCTLSKYSGSMNKTSGNLRTWKSMCNQFSTEAIDFRNKCLYQGETFRYLSLHKILWKRYYWFNHEQ